MPDGMIHGCGCWNCSEPRGGCSRGVLGSACGEICNPAQLKVSNMISAVFSPDFGGLRGFKGPGQFIAHGEYSRLIITGPVGGK